MARPFFAQFVALKTALRKRLTKGGLRARNKQRSLQQRQSEPVSLTDRLVSSKTLNMPIVERRERHKEVQDQYQGDRQLLLKERRQSEKMLQEQLARKKEEVDQHYRLSHYRPGDPRLLKAQRRAQEVYEKHERHMRVQHHLDWQDRWHNLRRGRDQRYRQITKDMKLEDRLALRQALDDGEASPWSIGRKESD